MQFATGGAEKADLHRSRRLVMGGSEEGAEAEEGNEGNSQYPASSGEVGKGSVEHIFQDQVRFSAS
jgi:hypothetical protein